MIANIKKLCEATRNAFERGENLSDLEENQQNQWRGFLGERYDHFNSGLGSLVFKSVLDEAVDALPPDENEDKFMAAIKVKFDEIKDKRAQAGQVMSHTEKIQYENAELFRKNVNSVVLILDRKDLKITPSNRPDYVVIESERCLDAVQFPVSNDSGDWLNLCSKFYYSRDRIPQANIFGTGIFIAPDKIATAAHVVYEASETGIHPDDMIFIGAHFVFGHIDHIQVRKNMIYQLDQDVVKKNNQMIQGVTGDSAWLTVKPLYGNADFRRTKPTDLNIKIPRIQNMDTKQPVYSLGHGFGVPNKLSFGGIIERISKKGWMGCDLDVFPGNSGSPVFHANSHELLGIISGPDNLWRQEISNQKCVNVKIDNDNGQSVETSQIELLIQKILNQ